ncbi:hypothetical protein LTR08_000622 [Meristemomyces frigidus]|nr:hypothetical protein LTR08_000622 [Meristemomyces frigidus]
MGSKKQRAKAGKAGKDKDAGMKTTQPPDVHQSVFEQAGTRESASTVRCHCEACTAPPSTADNSDSPFMRIPREVRDKIYSELLIAKHSPSTQAKIDEINASTSTPFGEYGRENALDCLDETGIMPGGTRQYPFIADTMGLLLANKQINAEANSVLFSENTFVILAEWERVWPFWRCDRTDCTPTNRPCFLMLHNLLQVKHLEILVHNTQPLDSRQLRVESARLRANLQIVADCFTEAGIKLKTLKVRYTSWFGGQVEAMRDAIEGPLRPGAPERPIRLKDDYGKYYLLHRADAQRRLFAHCEGVLAPLLKLQGFAEAVRVRGDLPGALIDRLTATLSNPNPPAAVKKKLVDERARKQAGLDEERRAEDSKHDFFKNLMETNLRKGDQGGADLCRQMLGTSANSPVVWAELMPPPPSQEDLDRWNDGRPAREAAAGAATAQGTVTEVDDDGEVADTGGANGGAGGVGVLNGKPVFGPPRPPGMV